ncbi:MAG: porin family protein [Candidatus Amulumruptor caecigallinarius]|nr:porin family protein [Candidatus Amulumruptor caecigallinarius]
MTKTQKIILQVAAFMFMLAPTVKAQEDYRFDIGLGFGFTGYLGDANSANLFAHPGWNGELLFRYIMNPRLNLKTGFYMGALSGDSADMDNVFPDAKTYSFSTTFYELGEMVEFHFFNYGMGESYRKLKRWTPYITAGLGMTAWSVDGKTNAAFTIPLGVGFKFKPALRWNLGLEFLMKKTFSDKLDGEVLADPLGIKSSFMKNTDWYSTVTLTISYEFSKRCAVCHYKE